MKNEIKKLILVLGDTVLINGGIILSFLIRFRGRLPETNFSVYKSLIVVITIIMIGALYSLGLYNTKKSYTMVNILDNTIGGVSIGSLILFVIFYSIRNKLGAFPTSVILISWVVNIFLISFFHILFAWIKKAIPKNVLIIGKGDEAENVIWSLKTHFSRQYNIVGIITNEEKDYGVKRFKNRNLRRVVKANNVDEVIIALPPQEHQDIGGIISQAPEIKFKIIPDLYEIFLTKTNGEDINGLPLVEVTSSPIYGLNELMKRFVDILVSSITLLVTLPISVITAIIIKIESKGSVFFTQQRVGKDGKVFSLYKFRSMVLDAEAITGPTLAKENDPRVTRFGRYIRKTRIDEIPQLINVLKGDMSLVGPRPERPYFVEKFKKQIPGYVQRLQVRPGITGLAQVRSKYDISAKDKLRYDLLYVRKHSLGLDLEIILRTLWTVLKRKGL